MRILVNGIYRDATEDEVRALQPSVEEMISSKVESIDQYDVSENVNSFTYQGQSFWIDKATRVGLVNSTNALIASGAEGTTIWFGTFHVTLPCSQVLEMLNAIEIYAIACYNTTARHKAEVSQLTTIEEIEAYDIKEGYPARLVF